MTEHYVDDNCCYLGGDPRLDDTGAATVELQTDSIRIELCRSDKEAAVVYIPRATIQGVRAVTEHLGMEQAEYEEGVVIESDERVVRHTTILDVEDPEHVESGGWHVRLAFRNEYFCKVFEKRCREAFDLPPF